MTDERLALLELVEKAADADLVREMLAFAAERIMEAEVEMLTGAAKGAHRAAGDPSERLPRAGLGHAGRADRAGDPEAAQGQLRPELSRAPPHGREGACGVRHCLSDHWRSNGSLQEAYVHGVSTRAADDLVKAMGAGGMKSQVSRLCAEIDERVNGLSRTGRWRGHGPTFGSTPPTSRSATAGAS